MGYTCATLNPITEDMIVPFAIFAADENGKFTINLGRSQRCCHRTSRAAQPPPPIM